MSADAVTELMKDWTKRELAETLANAAELTSDAVYTATVLDVQHRAQHGPRDDRSQRDSGRSAQLARRSPRVPVDER